MDGDNMTIIGFTATVFLGLALLLAVAHKCGYIFSCYFSVSHKSMMSDDDDDDDESFEPTFPRKPMYEYN
jgi:hypothetical protein